MARWSISHTRVPAKPMGDNRRCRAYFAANRSLRLSPAQQRRRRHKMHRAMS